jgi:hypothetical protein
MKNPNRKPDPKPKSIKWGRELLEKNLFKVVAYLPGEGSKDFLELKTKYYTSLYMENPKPLNLGKL